MKPDIIGENETGEYYVYRRYKGTLCKERSVFIPKGMSITKEQEEEIENDFRNFNGTKKFNKKLLFKADNKSI